MLYKLFRIGCANCFIYVVQAVSYMLCKLFHICCTSCFIYVVQTVSYMLCQAVSYMLCKLCISREINNIYIKHYVSVTWTASKQLPQNIVMLTEQLGCLFFKGFLVWSAIAIWTCIWVVIMWHTMFLPEVCISISLTF